MTNALSGPVLAWLLTYAMHSTLLLGAAWLLTRRQSLLPGARDFIWKTAMVGGIVTATLQLQVGVRPVGSVSLRSGVAAANPTVRDNQSAKTDEPSPDADVPAPQSDKTSGSGSIVATPAPSATNWKSVLVIAWAVIAFLLATVYAARRLILVGRLTDRQVVSEGPMVDMLGSLRNTSSHRGRVRLTAAATISSPVALGFGEICVPSAALTDLDAEQQRSLLAHEMAHLERHDPMWLAGASLLERVFFFQPLNRVARREMQRAAEYLCDDWAAARSGSGLPLANCLARVAEWIELSPLGVPVAGMAEQRSLLVSRIARLIEGGKAGTHVSRIALATASLAFLGAMVAAAPGANDSPQGAPVRASSGSAAPHEAGPRGNGPGSQPAIAGESEKKAPEDTVVTNALIERLKDTDASVRRAAANSLGNLRSRRAVPALIAVLTDKNREVRAAAAEALGNIDDDRAVHGLVGLITDESPDVREHALDALGRFAHSLTSAQVMPALQDQRANVRAKAVELLGEIGDHTVVGAVSKLLKDPVADVRHQAVHALEHLKDPSSAPMLIAALTDANGDVRSSALSALRELKVPIAEKAILDAMADESADVRHEAVHLVSDRPFPNALPMLRKLLEDSSADVRESAVEALGEMRSPQAREVLKAALKSSDPKVRRKAVEVLGERP